MITYQPPAVSQDDGQQYSSISVEEFRKRFKPRKNHLDSNASFDGQMYETYGPEIAYVKKILKKQPRRIWTVLEVDDGETVVSSGWHYVNRMGYIVTKVEFDEDELIEVVDKGDVLPFNINIRVDEDGSGTIESTMCEGSCSDNVVYSTIGIESLLLAMACEGIDLHTPEMVNAINKASQIVVAHIE
jgi:hypothetical protein